MATTLTTSISDVSTNALGILFDRKVYASLQPALYFESLCDVNTGLMGGNTDRFALFDQIATSSVTTLTEATNPTGVAVTVNTKDITPTQYGISVEVSDLVVITTFFDLLSNVSREVGYAIARKIDNVIQTTANAGTNVLYGGGKSARVNLAAGDSMDAFLLLKAAEKLDNQVAPPWADGTSMYRAVVAPNVMYDLKSNTGVGQWVDVRKYANPDQILNGEKGSMHGVRLMQSPNVQSFSSTITVYPTLVAGAGGIRVSYWLPNKIRNYLNNPEDANIANPLGQKGNVGAKTNIGVSITQDARLVRIETSGNTLT